MKYSIWIVALGLVSACNQQTTDTRQEEKMSSVSQASLYTTTMTETSGSGDTDPEEVVDYAKLFYGVPYKYGSTDPEVGFDCSGFINYVYNHFDIDVPRSSVDFTDVGTPVQLARATPGDLILFTGTDPSTRTVGHIGIVVKNDDSGLEFIHSSSGKQSAVTITPLNDYYEQRFVKVVRLL
ncbi:C40 family peptidase [Telluribacter humicola]|uniref:C40 family peptidase n=1 Tax=Telluribacter humicola TaxID=1720261 RepID=UPI001A976099|nr:C40 family peptidase [Telluribacter humicola]